MIALAALGATVLPGLRAPSPRLAALFAAPMLKLRAVGSGRITSVAASLGMPVVPATVLLNLHIDHLSDAALVEMRSRLAQARARRETSLAPGAAAPERQRDAADTEIEQIERTIATAGGRAPTELPVLAGVYGLVWSIDAQAGAAIQPGDPLAQLADCGRAFLVMRDTPAGLKAGEAVFVQLPGVHIFRGVMRASSGIAEPPSTLVVEPTGLAAAAPEACPVGTTAEVQVDPGG